MLNVGVSCPGGCVHTLTGHQSLTSGMELRDHLLVSGNADSTVRVWDIRTGQCLHTLQGEPGGSGDPAGVTLSLSPGPHRHQSAVTCLQFCRGLVLTSSDDGTVKLWDLKTGAWLRDVVALQSRGSGQNWPRLAPAAHTHLPVIHRGRGLANPGVGHSAGVRRRQQERDGGHQTAGAGLCPGGRDGRRGGVFLTCQSGSLLLGQSQRPTLLT